MNNEQVIYTFNKFYFDFIKDIKNANNELKMRIRKNYKVVELKDTQHYDTFLERSEGILEIVANTCPNTLLTHEKLVSWEIIQDIKLSDITMLVPVTQHNTVKSFLYILTTLAIIGNTATSDDGAALVKVLDVMKTIQQKEDEAFDKLLSDILDDDITAALRSLKEVMSTAISLDTGDVENMSANGGIDASMLDNTTIGNLAKEISAELDFSSMSNIQKPEDFMNLTNIGSIVNKVGSKIQTKLTNGEINQQDLVNEAFSFLNVLNKGGNGNPMLSSMMRNFMGGNKGRVQVNESKLKEVSTKDRLRKKLDERKKDGPL
jgi:hypothetical protein